MPSETRQADDPLQPLTRHSKLAWRLGLAVGLLVLAACGLFWSRQSTRPAPVPTWAEIQKAAQAQRWDEVEPKLERWVAVNSRHGEGLVVLANLYLRRGRRQEAEKLLSAV